MNDPKQQILSKVLKLMNRTPMKNQQIVQPQSNRKSDFSTFIEATNYKQSANWTPRLSSRKPIFNKNNKIIEDRHQIKDKQPQPAIKQAPLNFCNQSSQNFDKKVILYTCECEGKSQTCKIIKKNLLKNVNVPQLKRVYSSLTNKSTKHSNPYYIYDTFLQTLPSSYSRAEIAHLNNLMLAMNIDYFTTPQFQCLSSIHSHSKEECITYYLYNDLKSYLPSFPTFKHMYERSLRQLGLKQEKVREHYQEMGQGIDYKYFIEDFYQSVGANVVPNCYYVQLLDKVYQHGADPLIELLKVLLTQQSQTIMYHFRFVRMCKFHYSRLHMLMLDWNQIFQNLSRH